MTGKRKFSGNRQLVEQFESKLARLLPADGDEDADEEEEEEKAQDDPLGAEGKIITAELRRMTDALRTMQERVIGLEKSSRPAAPQTGGQDYHLIERLAALEKQLQDAIASGLAPVLQHPNAVGVEVSQDPADWGAPAAASFASPKK